MPVEAPNGLLIGTGDDESADVQAWTVQTRTGVSLPNPVSGSALIFFDGTDIILRNSAGAEFLLGGPSAVETLSATLAAGNTTGAQTIEISSGGKILFDRVQSLIIDAATMGAPTVITFPDPGLAADTVVYAQAIQTLAQKTLTLPTVADFSNMTHDHQDPIGGAQLDVNLATTGLLDEGRLDVGVDGEVLTTVAGVATWESSVAGPWNEIASVVDVGKTVLHPDAIITDVVQIGATDIVQAGDQFGVSGRSRLNDVRFVSGSIVRPESDEQGKLGLHTVFGDAINKRWLQVVTSNLRTGDIIMDNEWKITEVWDDDSIGPAEGKESRGIAFLNSIGKKVACLDEKGNLYITGNLKKSQSIN